MRIPSPLSLGLLPPFQPRNHVFPIQYASGYSIGYPNLFWAYTLAAPSKKRRLPRRSKLIHRRHKTVLRVCTGRKTLRTLV